ncbi:MAG: hypothetical protein GXP42_00440 [Chloroflexi bacterium]|nr:hypothetical protein [Chloroflexota bacterium]
MTTTPHTQLHIASFLVRLRWEAKDDNQSPPTFFGELEHIQSGERWFFQDLRELSLLIQTRVQHVIQER